MSAPVLAVRLAAGYAKHTLLQDLAFDLFPGERLGLLGPSGSGKSTLLLALMGLLPLRGGWVKGEVLLQGRNLLAMPKKEARAMRGSAMALVPQSPMTALNPALSLATHFREAWRAHQVSDPTRFARRVAELMQRMQLPHDPAFLRRTPGQLSVGQAQRCTLAMALLHEPAVLIADEPTASLDPVTQTEVLKLLQEICRESDTALLFVSHDLLSVLRLCSSIAVLASGSIGERLATEQIVTATHPELRTLLRALPLPPEVLLKHMKTGTPDADRTLQNEAAMAHAR